ncbi:MAG: PEP-CTERM sorting domain-containing protein [Hyphomicrobiaceae bacterium]
MRASTTKVSSAGDAPSTPICPAALLTRKPRGYPEPSIVSGFVVVAVDVLILLLRKKWFS